MGSAASILDLSAIDLIEAMGSGSLRATDVMTAFLERVDEIEPSIHAWVIVDRAGAMAGAARADAQRGRGEPMARLHGLPVGIKDIIDTLDLPTRYGCAGYQHRRPTKDATLVTRLREAGAIVVGKTVTAEFAYKYPGSTRNPHDLLRTPGGSSSGSAAAVATHMVPVALGTQTKGSVIRPAAYCGVVGYKPGLGVLSRAGILSQSLLLDQPGVMARTVADAALLVEVMSGPDPSDPMSTSATELLASALAGSRPPRLALLHGPYWHRVEDGAQRKLDTLAGQLGLPTVELPQRFAEIETAIDQLVAYGIAAAIEREPPARRDLLSTDLQDVVRIGKLVTETQVRAVQQLRVELFDAFATLMLGYDALVTLSTTGVAPSFESGTGDPILATTATFVGAPAITLPLLQGDTGLPLGVQLIGQTAGDVALLTAAGWLERSMAAGPPRRQDVGR